MCAETPSPQPIASSPPPAETPLRASVLVRAQLPPGTQLKITLELVDVRGETLAEQTFTAQDEQPPVELSLDAGLPLPNLKPVRAWLRGLGWGLGLALVVYLLVRLIGLAQYPIYFFTDEAVQTVLAGDFLRDGLRGYDQIFLPTYFRNVYQYNLGVSVYLQVLPLQLFGKSVEVTRGVNVLVSLLAALSSGLALKRIFHIRYPWLGVLLLSATPAWFLHSRTAFETSLAVSFYAAFLYCYMLYRSGQPRAIYAALIFGALSFYSYSPAQMVMAVSAVLLLISDARYHWQQRRVLGRALLLAAVLAVPYLRFQAAHPEESLNHLRQIGSYWIQPISSGEKLSRFASEYLKAFSPVYWYTAPPDADLARHIMNGYGHLLRYSLPFGLLGMGLALKNWRDWKYRALLIAVLAAPAGAALAQLGITRALFMVIPAALLTALGLQVAIDWMIRRLRVPHLAAAAAFALLLGGFNFYLLADALLRGPTWTTNYTLNGLQYGARQVFNAALDYSAAHPRSHVVISPTWANGTDVLARFFLPETAPIELRSIDAYLNEFQPIDENMVFVLPPEEYTRAAASPKFTDVTVLQTLPYPDGTDGFYFLKLRYADNIDEIMQKELAERRAVVSSEVMVNGETVQVSYSRLDMGEINNLFDGNPATLVRTLAANPLQLQVNFPAPRQVSAVVLRVGSAATSIEVILQVPGQADAYVIQQELERSSVLRDHEIVFNGWYAASQVTISVKNTHDLEPAHVHLWEVTFK